MSHEHWTSCRCPNILTFCLGGTYLCGLIPHAPIFLTKHFTPCVYWSCILLSKQKRIWKHSAVRKKDFQQFHLLQYLRFNQGLYFSLKFFRWINTFLYFLSSVQSIAARWPINKSLLCQTTHRVVYVKFQHTHTSTSRLSIHQVKLVALKLNLKNEIFTYQNTKIFIPADLGRAF